MTSTFYRKVEEYMIPKVPGDNRVRTRAKVFTMILFSTKYLYLPSVSLLYMKAWHSISLKKNNLLVFMYTAMSVFWSFQVTFFIPSVLCHAPPLISQVFTFSLQVSPASQTRSKCGPSIFLSNSQTLHSK